MNRSGPPARTAKELADLARETRVLADEIAQGLRSNPERLNMPTIMSAILRGLRNQEAILDALAGLAVPAPVETLRPHAPGANGGSSRLRRPSESIAKHDGDVLHGGVHGGAHDGDALEGDALEIEPEPRRPEPIAVPRDLDRGGREASSVAGPRGRAIVCEFDNRDRSFDRGLSKLNAWLSSGGLGLPFQKRDGHAYLNTGALSEAMLAAVERELTGREGYSVKLGRLVVDGLQGDVVIYAKLPAGGSPSNDAHGERDPHG